MQKTLIRLPVTARTGDVHPPIDKLPDRLPLYSVDDVLVDIVDETTARKLLKDGTVQVLRTKSKVRYLRVRAHKRSELISTATKSKYDLAHRKRPMGQSHNRENDQNPAGVWTIDRIPRRAEDLFVFSLDGKRAA